MTDLIRQIATLLGIILMSVSGLAVVAFVCYLAVLFIAGQLAKVFNLSAILFEAARIVRDRRKAKESNQ